MGSLLIIVMLGALVAANRIPGLERYALERNAASYSLFVLFMLIPVFRFLNRPLQMFASAMIGWGIFVVAYDIAGMVFRDLFQVLRTPFPGADRGSDNLRRHGGRLVGGSDGDSGATPADCAPPPPRG